MNQEAQMLEKIKQFSGDDNCWHKVSADFIHTLNYIGLDKKTARNLTLKVRNIINHNDVYPVIEKRIHDLLETYHLTENIGHALSGRAELIFSQTHPYIIQEGRLMDFGCGDQASQPVDCTKSSS